MQRWWDLAAAGTAADFIPEGTNFGEPFDILRNLTGQTLTGTEFKLDWSDSNQVAHTKFIEIEYTRPGKS